MNYKIDGTTMDNVEDLDWAMPMSNLTEYSSNHSETTRSYGFILNMKQLILMQILLIPMTLNRSCIWPNY